MAFYAALTSAIQLLDDVFNTNQYPALASSHTLQSLHQKFTHLLDSLQDYSSKGDESINCVETRIRDAAYRVLDIIESELPAWKSLLVGHEQELQKVGREVDSILQELIAIKERQMQGDLRQCAESEQEQPAIGTRDTNTVVGFVESQYAIKSQLCGLSPQLQVIPIVGMGGIGKTTLARNIFEDDLIVYEFDFRAWVAISQDYDVIRVLKHIIESLGITTSPDKLLIREQDEVSEEEMSKRDVVLEEEEMSDAEKEVALKTHIYKYLKGRKFLIVIDDVWSTQVWDDVKHAFPDDRIGSRILLTTRLEDVAGYVCSSDSLHQMKFLDENASWTLLQEKAFTQECCPPALVNIGKCIASKCRGLPLAIVVVGGILSKDQTLQFWESVAADVGSVLNKPDADLSNVLSLSYNHLPHHLKACFLYMGIFPEDYEINISKLIKLWIGEGFLKSDSKSRTLEEVGKECLEELVKRNLVIIMKKRENKEFKSCVMHDLLRDFSRKRGLHEHFFHVTNQEWRLQRNGVEKVRRIILHPDTVFTPWRCENGEYVRSLCWFSKRTGSLGGNLELDNVNLLRILNVADLETSIPFTISRMLHLKYLALRLSSSQNWAPDVISKLQNLEMLMISYSTLERIVCPFEIWKMAGLKYLIIKRTVLPFIHGKDILLTKLEYLHTLQTVEDFVLTNEVTQMISNIQKLKMLCWGTEPDDIWKRHCLDNLVNMLQLEKLNIEFIDHPYNDSILSSFSMPQNLTRLSLKGCKLPWEMLTLVGSLKCLQVLKLRSNAVIGQVWAPVEGEFLELKFLLLELLDLKHWQAESTHFPKLEHLKIDDCWKLEEIPLDIGEIGTLKFITVDDSKLAGNSAKKILEEQRELENYELQVTVRVSSNLFRRDPRWI